MEKWKWVLETVVAIVHMLRTICLHVVTLLAALHLDVDVVVDHYDVANGISEASVFFCTVALVAQTWVTLWLCVHQHNFLSVSSCLTMLIPVSVLSNFSLCLFVSCLLPLQCNQVCLILIEPATEKMEWGHFALIVLDAMLCSDVTKEIVWQLIICHIPAELFCYVATP